MDVVPSAQLLKPPSTDKQSKSDLLDMVMEEDYLDVKADTGGLKKVRFTAEDSFKLGGRSAASESMMSMSMASSF